MLLDGLRLPPPLDPTAGAYKDWLHVNVFDHASGTVGLVNASLHGPPTDRRSRVVGAALFDVPDVGWVGNLAVRDLHTAALGPGFVGTDVLGLAVDHRTGTVVATADLPDDRTAVRLEARATSRAVMVEEPLPLGSGWISWYVVPRLEATGTLRAGDVTVPLDGAVAYHDHNWGRWHWGDDFGWDWASFAAPAPGPTIVLARTTDRLHRVRAPATLLVAMDSVSRRFTGPFVEVSEHGTLDGPLRRVPGAMAALRTDRARPRLPATLRVHARRGDDRLELHFTARAAAQLVLADPVARGQSFVHESTGTFTVTGRLAGQDVAAHGLGVVERVD